MNKLDQNVTDFLSSQRFVVVATINADGTIHSSCKGLVKISPKGAVYLLDLYRGRTYANLALNPQIAITAVDEHRFVGYTLSGKARVVKNRQLPAHIITAWENLITSRITNRIIRNIHGEKGHPLHPEALLPVPEYMIVVNVRRVTDLTPRHISSKL